MGEWKYSSTIIDLGTRWMRINTFTPQPLYHRGKIPRCLLDRRLDRPQKLSGLCGEEKNLASSGIETGSSSP
jgi:hypothetical protein